MKSKIRMFLLPAGMGLIGALSLLGLYIGIFSAVQSPSQAINQFWQNKAMLLPLALGFALQVGMYVWLRQRIQHPFALMGGRASTTASGGTSGAAVLACCAPALLRALPLIAVSSPILGLTPVIAFLARWQMPITILGWLANIAGIGVMAYSFYKIHRLSAPQKSLSPSTSS